MKTTTTTESTHARRRAGRPGLDSRPGPGARENGTRKSAEARRGRPRTLHRCHPCSSERLYTDEESTFLAACEAHRLALGRRFLLATDYLAVARALGYRREGPAR